jgi:hypothetical protein
MWPTASQDVGRARWLLWAENEDGFAGCQRQDFGVSWGNVAKASPTGRSPKRAFAGMICLLAMFLMQAPLVLATWSISTGMCCTGDFCPIAAHHHKKIATEPAHQMNCGHEMSGMSNCAMSCCHDTDQPTIAANLFVMPAAQSFVVQTAVAGVVEAPKPQGIIFSAKPVSPPPRSLASSI